MPLQSGEHADFILPDAEFAPTRQAVQAADRQRKEEVFEHTQRCWRSMTRRERTNTEAYAEAVERYARVELTEWVPRRDWVGLPIETMVRDGVHGDVVKKLMSVAGDKPRRVLATDMNYPTNRTTDFVDEVNGVTVTFDRPSNSVRYEVHSGDGALVRARRSWLREALLDRMESMRWTRGTGGVVVRDGEAVGLDGGAEGRVESVTAGYGYIGLDRCPEVTTPFGGDRTRVPAVAAGYGVARGKSTPESTAGSFRARVASESQVVDLP